jgi:ArsR family transcriptional regulator, virulence genes transcriptional regulator
MDIQDLQTKSEEASELLAVLANRRRLAILCELHKGERQVGELEKVLDLSQSALSQHLAKLREAQVVRTRREAQTIFYSISDARAERLLAALFDMFCVSAKPVRNARSSKT